MPLNADIWTSLVTLLLLIVSCQLTAVMALSCYECNSFKDAACSGNTLEKFKVTCKEGSVGCRKMQFLLDLKGTGTIEDRIARQCAKATGEVGCSTKYGTNGKRYKEFVCECSGDYCNESTRSRSLTLFVYIVSIVTLIVIA